jgi:hypothetical protein
MVIRTAFDFALAVSGGTHVFLQTASDWMRQRDFEDFGLNAANYILTNLMRRRLGKLLYVFRGPVSKADEVHKGLRLGTESVRIPSTNGFLLGELLALVRSTCPDQISRGGAAHITQESIEFPMATVKLEDLYFAHDWEAQGRRSTPILIGTADSIKNQ